MSHLVLIHCGSNGRGNGAIGFGDALRDDRPCYPPTQAGNDYWWLSDELHDSLDSPYSLRYSDPHWIVEISDVKSAVMFKLMWGTK